MNTVLLTGLTSYLGSHIAKILLKKLHSSSYNIKATVRNKNKLQSLSPLIKEGGQEAFNRITLVEMDLNKPESLIDAISP